MIRNKVRLVVDCQEEGIDYEQIPTLQRVRRLESVRIFIAYAAHRNIEVFQMDVKYAFLNGELEETIYMEQPPGFARSIRIISTS